jgi:murein DD-endopeptidase MepM/ murein hydrolase activator NlpD
VGFVVIVGASIAVPAYAQTQPVAAAPELQSLSVAAQVPIAAVARDAYTVTAPPALEWPVDPSSPIASPFGPRVSPCAGCSSVHEGADFDAGYGAQVHAIAAGVVVETDAPGWAALGVHVAIQHEIDGQVVTSAYGHMQTGSMTLRVGDVVYAGEVIGLVGSTGASTGPHLHFEIRIGGTTPVDPLPWMHARLG